MFVIVKFFFRRFIFFFQPDFCRCSLFQSIHTIRKCRFVGLDTIKQHVKKNVLQIFAPVSSVSNLCRSCHGTLTAIYYTKHYILICWHLLLCAHLVGYNRHTWQSHNRGDVSLQKLTMFSGLQWVKSCGAVMSSHFSGCSFEMSAGDCSVKGPVS